jgi:hypothetical protein
LRSAQIPVDLDAGDERVHLRLARAHQVDLAHEALARADAAGLPIVLDLTPGGSRKPLEQQVGRIDRSDSSVEIDEHATFHTRT